MKVLMIIVFISGAAYCGPPLGLEELAAVVVGDEEAVSGLERSILGCDVVAQTQYGPVCGRRRPATNGALYASFRGIRYARAPLRELRFAEPQEPDHYDTIFDASEHGPICPQKILIGPIMMPNSMGEDCLRVNVHTPALPDAGDDTRPLLPVLFFIHGGGFSYGSGDADYHGPEYLMAGQDIVVVTINYRLGAIGFLSLFSKEIPGNVGLRDAVFALKWVRDNIKNFGGDPEEVTVFGQSAGAAMTHLLSISPSVQEQKLFKRAFAMSGSAIAGFYSPSRRFAEFMANKFLKAAKIDSQQSPEKIHEELIKLPAEKLVKAFTTVNEDTGTGTFGPVIEAPMDNLIPIIPKDPEDLLNEGYGNDIVTWLSYCKNEAQAFRQRYKKVDEVEILRHMPIFKIPLNIAWAANEMAIPFMIELISKEYYNTSATLNNFLSVLTDGNYKYPATKIVEKRLSTSASPSYISEFAYGSPFTVYKIVAQGDWESAAHSEDLTYVFRCNSLKLPVGFSPVDELEQDNDDSRMTSWMTSLVTQFVKTGSPVSCGNESLWPATGPQLQHQYMATPYEYQLQDLSPYLEGKVKFFDKLKRIGRQRKIV